MWWILSSILQRGKILLGVLQGLRGHDFYSYAPPPLVFKKHNFKHIVNAISIISIVVEWGYNTFITHPPPPPTPPFPLPIYTLAYKGTELSRDRYRERDKWERRKVALARLMAQYFPPGQESWKCHFSCWSTFIAVCLSSFYLTNIEVEFLSWATHSMVSGAYTRFLSESVVIFLFAKKIRPIFIYFISPGPFSTPLHSLLMEMSYVKKIADITFFLT